jgi:hypothetical protein
VFGTSPGFTTAANPASDDGAALGTTALGWSDAFYASGGTIHFANTDWVATHTSGILTVGTGDLRITTAGTNTASVVTVGGAQTLTSKTLTAPSIDTINLTGGQIAFPAAVNVSADANTLDDYEEGTSTSSFAAAAGSFGATTYDLTNIYYTKIGNRVFVNGQCRTDSLTVNTASGQLYVTGLPFTVANTVNNSYAGYVGLSSSWAGDHPSHGTFLTNTVHFELYHRDASDGASQTTEPSDLTAGSSANSNWVRFGGHYHI